MTIARRILDAVTLRRVVAALLIGGFAKSILPFLSWLAGTGWGLWSVASVRALLLATLVFAVDAVLIYLALRGLGSVLERWRADRQTLAAEAAADEEHDPSGVFEEFEASGTEAAGWPREGGDDGGGTERY
jgi:hypothetical protein